ncbi:MAG: hypothetical protein Q8K89_11760, partial [Actinomycetota bacterium]|nr:hypothetical protein [Actinomycetota bacterium]
MNTLRTLGDLVGFITFFSAFGVLLAVPTSRTGGLTPLVKYLLLATLGCYVFVTASDVVVQFELTTATEGFEDYAEALYPIL